MENGYPRPTNEPGVASIMRKPDEINDIKAVGPNGMCSVRMFCNLPRLIKPCKYFNISYTVLICVTSYHDIVSYHDIHMYHYCIAGMFGRAEVCCIKCDWQKRFGEYA